MPPWLLIALGIAYIVGNVMLPMWLAPRWVDERVTHGRLALVLTATRFGPLLLAVIYTAAIGGNWWVLLIIVSAVAVTSFWMLDGLLGYSESIGVREAIRSLRDSQRKKRQRD